MSMKAVNSAAKALNQYIDSAVAYLKVNAIPILALLGAYYVYKNYCKYCLYCTILNCPGFSLFYSFIEDHYCYTCLSDA